MCHHYIISQNRLQETLVSIAIHKNVFVRGINLTIIMDKQYLEIFTAVHNDSFFMLTSAKVIIGFYSNNTLVLGTYKIL